VTDTWCGIGRRPHTRAWLVNGFVAKAVSGIGATVGLIELLALELDHREFYLNYQPKFHAPDRPIIGVEALIRRKHPTRGIIGQNYFIKIAE